MANSTAPQSIVSRISVDSHGIITAGRLRCFIDEKPSSSYFGNEVLLEGWCFDLNTSSPVRVGVDFQVFELDPEQQGELKDDKLRRNRRRPSFRCFAKAVDRPDVQQYFSALQISSKVGFVVSIPIAKRARYAISLFGITEDGEDQVFDYAEFLVAKTFKESLLGVDEQPKRDDSKKYQFWCETKTNFRTLSYKTYFRGWCRRLDGQAIDEMRVRIGPTTQDLTFGIGRSDIARHFQNRPGTLNSGFEGTIFIEELPAELTFEALFAGSWISLATITVNRFSFFGRCFALPGQTAKEGLAAIKQFLFDLKPHVYGNFHEYAPRNIQAEKFPAPSTIDPSELPTISIVTPSYNQDQYLGATIKSVVEQTGIRLQYVVMDGGSKDNSVEVIRKYEARLTAWTSEKDEGQSDAICRGFERLECAPDDIMAYLNSDDLLMPGALRFVAEYFYNHPDVDAVYGNRIVIDSYGGETSRWITPFFQRRLLDYVDLIPQETLFWRRRIYDRVGGIDKAFRFAMDWDLLVRFSSAGAKMVRLPYFLGCFRVHELSKTSQQSGTIGAKECDIIRKRIHGRELKRSLIQAKFDRAEWQGLLLKKLSRLGIRI